jgi:BirA family biotin operon repressor/biotin-[acetyl-CoA-carboxylase] ligase
VNSLTFSLLRLLADGEFHSGETMARSLAVSRASVWNALHALDQVGLAVFKVRGRGYRLAQALNLLDGAQVAHYLAGHAQRFAVEVLTSTESTNTLLLQRATAGAPAGSVIAAEWQTQGRGRRGRVWHAMPGAALTFSVLWRFQQGAGFLSGLSLAVGVALVRALDRLGIKDARLKWPNDVWWHDSKLAGILIEMHGDMLGPSAAVIGIGLNCRMPDILRSRIDQAATDLETASGTTLDRNRVLAALLVELESVLDAFARDGFAPLRDEWQRYHVFHGKRVRLVMPDGASMTGVVQGVAEDGALLLESHNGARRLYGGEVSRLRG